MINGETQHFLQTDRKVRMEMDIEHFYIEKGQGAPLILLHGNGENSGYFHSQIEAFSEYYHVYAIDTRGHGKTPRGSAPFTIRQFADDLLGFMDEKQIRKAHLLGFSDGGNVAMAFSVHYPKRVNCLILNGANLYPEGVRWRTQAPVELGFKIAKLFSKHSVKAKQREEMLGLMVHDPNLSPKEVSKIKARTLVIAGTRDVIRKEHTKLIADSISGAELVFIRGNHYVALHNPEAFNKEVLSFLSQNAGKTET